MEWMQIVGVALCCAAVLAVVRSCKPEMALYVSLAAGVFLLLLVLDQIQIVLDFFREFSSMLEFGGTYFPVLGKVLAVAYLADFTAQTCRDAGASSLGEKVEFAGKLFIFVLAIPLLRDILSMLQTLLEG